MIRASHWWSAPFLHFHQTLLELPIQNCSGLILPFLVGCHCLAIAGTSDKLLVLEGFLPRQNGHLSPGRRLKVDFQIWSFAFGHFHQTLVCQGSLYGSIPLFLSFINVFRIL